MNLRIYLTVFGVLLLGYTKAQQQDGGDPYSKDEIFIDGDDDLEGSGGGRGGEVKDDLESSGSGNGPGEDDEDGYGSEINVESPKPPTKAPKDPYRAREPIIEKHPQTPLEKAPLPKENEIGGVGTDSGIGGGTGGLQPNSEDNDINEVRTDDGNQESNEVYIMDTKPEERATSFFSQPGILAAVIGGAVVGLLCAILVVMFVVYRMRKKDEGSYALDEPKRSPTVNSYTKNSNREFYA
ncbi:syndecan isoform X2 [Hetaerina americana]|uniref:syndecan isoform X2 n=1 Tax=Hetaerina americana TaxID=62018 RepID=UPI003A7F3F8C